MSARLLAACTLAFACCIGWAQAPAPAPPAAAAGELVHEGVVPASSVYDMWTVVYFEEVAPEQTHVRIVAHGFTDDEESQRMRAFFDRGNAATLKQMQDRIR